MVGFLPVAPGLSHLRALQMIVIASDAAEDLLRHASASRDGSETGGILLGHDEGLHGEVRIMACGGPGPLAVRRPDRFMRDRDHAQELADRAFQQGHTWVGEWHTHVTPMHAPSATDLATYRRLLEGGAFTSPRMTALIVLAADTSWTSATIYGWTFTGTVLRSVSCSIATTTNTSCATTVNTPLEENR